jgi:predicted metal-dependent hydrolase
MPESLNIMWSIGRSKDPAPDEALPLPVEIRAIRSARRLRLRIDEQRMVLKLTCPARMSRKAALSWAAGQRAWVERQLAAIEPGEPMVPGGVIPVEGQDIALAWLELLPRTPRLQGATLSCGGPVEGFGARIECFLKRHALKLLSAETAEFAARVEANVRSLTVGDAGTRWGSCSSQGRIRYSWRLVLAPPEARRFVVAHEVAHLVHLNHGPEFKALERQLLGEDPAGARALLRRVGPRLKRIGRRH